LQTKDTAKVVLFLSPPNKRKNGMRMQAKKNEKNMKNAENRNKIKQNTLADRSFWIKMSWCYHKGTNGLFSQKQLKRQANYSPLNKKQKITEKQLQKIKKPNHT